MVVFSGQLEVGSLRRGRLWEGFIRPMRGWSKVVYQVYGAHVSSCDGPRFRG